MSTPMNIPMHRFRYTNLTKDQVGEKLKATDTGPVSVSELSDVLAGRTFRIVTDKGLTLNYEFRSRNQLTLSENGGANIQAGYGALTIKGGIVFSHMVPGAQKGYNVFVDLETDLVTVFEVWFSSGRKEVTLGNNEIVVDDREAQREIYFGYLDVAGRKPPEGRHHLTNRVEGRALHWKQDTGIETLEFYTSVVSVNFVELTRHTDYLGFCSPSDYILINDNLFIHSRTETEFSGIFTFLVMDLFSVTQVGVRLGFNERDELEYYMFRGDGEIVGHIARLEPFGEHGRAGMVVQSSKDPQTPGKGQRLVYRPVRDFPHLTDEQVHEAALRRTVAFGGGGGDAPQMMANNNLPFTDKLVGREFTLRYDRVGPVRHYRFQDKYKLSYRDEGETRWQEADTRVYEPDGDLFYFSHLLIDSKPRASVQIAVDFANGLTTCVHSQMGTPYYGNETTYYPLFGVMEMAGIHPPRYMRHELTSELVGRCISMSWSDQMTSMHLYSSNQSMCWTIFTDDQTRGAQWSAPCIFIKLRPDIYLISINEEACNGAQMIELINLKTMRACGFGFIGNAMGVSLSLTGALVRNIGRFDVTKFYGPR